MGNLQELINRLCPNGVPYLPISEIGTLTRGKRFVHADAVDDGIPCIHYGELYTYYGIATEQTKSHVREELKSKLRYAHKNDVIIVGAGENDVDIGIAVAYLGEEEIAIHDACYILSHECDPKYISYCLRTESYHQQIKKYVSSGKICAISAEGIGKAKIPVPPLEVQREIVQILDKFTLLSAELSAELSARKTQYNYYRDKLLHIEGDRITISDLFDTRNGFTPSKKESSYWENGDIPWFKLEDIKEKGRVLSDSNLHITHNALKKSGLFKENSIIISTSATIGEYALVTVPFLCNQRFTCLTLKPEYSERINIKYLMHYCPILSEYCKNHLNQGNFASVDMKKFKEFEFVIPSIEEQEHIISVLDRFDMLCSDLSIGLPAEIDARNKQYEYYRDKLLTFKEAV